MSKFYHEIDKALQSYEFFRPYHDRSLEWICARIDWCWKWKKISEQEKDELCNRAIAVLERGIYD